MENGVSPSHRDAARHCEAGGFVLGFSSLQPGLDKTSRHLLGYSPLILIPGSRFGGEPIRGGRHG